jgi:hypothetical protein
MHGDMYETLWTKSQPCSLKTVAAAGSNMSSPPVCEQLVNSAILIHSPIPCLVTLVTHVTAHHACMGVMHTTAPPPCACDGVMHACISRGGSLIHVMELLSLLTDCQLPQSMDSSCCTLSLLKSSLLETCPVHEHRSACTLHTPHSIVQSGDMQP